MIRRPRVRARLVVSLLAATVLSALPARGAPGEPFQDGARCVFIGHSFFIPVAEAFDDVAAQNSFPRHRADTVFRGGPLGSPGAMWDDASTRAQVEALLAVGDVEIFGLTWFSPANSSQEDFEPWIDLALQYNPRTRFFVGAPWGPGGPSLDVQAFDEATESFALAAFATVEGLRATYPDADIDFLAYGKTASVMKRMFENGALPDITVEVGPGPDALFEDGFIGHGGPMMLDVSALSWLDLLYGASPETLTYGPYVSDTESIVGEVMQFSEAFQEIGDTYCATAPHSGDDAAHLSALGGASVTESTFTLRVTGAPAAASGLFFFGSEQIDAPFGDGRLCVGGPLTRMGPVVTTDGAGVATHAVDLGASYGPALLIGAPGTNFQFWFRDAASASSGSNTSDALNVELQP